MESKTMKSSFLLSDFQMNLIIIVKNTIEKLREIN